MVYPTVIKKKKRFEEEGNIAIPQKNRPFKLKERTVPTVPSVPNAPSSGAQEVRNTAQDKIQLLDQGFDSERYPQMNVSSHGETDESGLDKAYANPSNFHLDRNGVLYGAGTKGSFLGSEWIENYLTIGAPLVANALGVKTPYPIEDNERYKQLDDFMKANSRQVKGMVMHSKAAAVAHRWMQNHPEWKGQSRLYATPYEDVLGKEAIKNGLDKFKEDSKNPFVNSIVDKGEQFFGLNEVKPVKGERRIANNFDPATLLDRSAERYDHGNPWKYLMNGGPHDYHEGIARFESGFGLKNAIANKPGTDIDKNYKNPFNLPNNYKWKSPMSSGPQGSKTTWQNPDGTTSLTQ